MENIKHRELHACQSSHVVFLRFRDKVLFVVPRERGKSYPRLEMTNTEFPWQWNITFRLFTAYWLQRVRVSTLKIPRARSHFSEFVEEYVYMRISSPISFFFCKDKLGDFARFRDPGTRNRGDTSYRIAEKRNRRRVRVKISLRHSD